MRPNRPLRSPGLRAALLLCWCSLALAGCLGCGSDAPGGPDAGASCTKSSQCGVGEGCIQNHCTPLPCGGCQPDEVCQDSGTCAPAQGASCPTAGCPAGYTCNKNQVCSKPCVVDHDCDTGLVCNSNTGTCAQCVFDANCSKVTGKPRCDSTSGNCVACLQPIDCTSALGSGHYCDLSTHSCAAGCKTNGDCNLANGERCDGATATAPGTCIQCKAATEGTDCGISAPACDPTGHCVVCTADKYCSPATPRCDPGPPSTCVQCLPSHNATGEDCGYAFTNGGTKDPHNALTCDPTAKQCVPGCAGETQCGCPIDPGTHLPTSCSRRYVGEHCDPTLTAMPNIAGPAEGGCVECRVGFNADCHCKVKGSTAATPGCDANWPKLGALNGARCVKNASTSFGECTEGCDTNADCPANKLCSLSGATAHTCVECSCPSGPQGSGPDANWCNDVSGTNPIGGCGLKQSGQEVCDVHTLTCRLRRQSELCDSSIECGDTLDPTVGQCIPGAKFCVKSSHAYATGSPTQYCDVGKVLGRCGIACNDPQANSCVAGVACPTGTSCRQSTATDQPPSGPNTGQYCVPTSLCSTQ